MRSESKQGDGVQNSGSSSVRAIVIGGFVAGLLDLLYAVVVYSPKHPILIPQTIASGVLGAKSYECGPASALLGIVLHFVIAFGAAAGYYVASRYLTFILRRTVLWGIIYGSLVYLFMHVIVLPLSLVPRHGYSLFRMTTEFIEHWFFVGMPIVVSVKHYASYAARPTAPEYRGDSLLSSIRERDL